MTSAARNAAIAFFLLPIPGAAPHAETAAPNNSPVVAGFIETAVLYPGRHPIKAKLDTGARTSSLGVVRQRIFTENGRNSVAFSVRLDDGTEASLVRPVVRTARIKEHAGAPMKRPVVMLNICLGKTVRLTEVNLQDRRNFQYTLLVGRRFLADGFVVDPGKRNQLSVECPPDGEVRE